MISNKILLMCCQPCLWEPTWFDQEVWAHVLQAVLPQQRQGDWLHQGQYLMVMISKNKLIGWALLTSSSYGLDQIF